MRFESLFPLATAPEQVLTIARMDVGVPLTSGRLVYRLHEDGRLEARLTEFDLFGGRIESEPMMLDIATGDVTAVLNVTGMPLAQLLELTRFGELSATGVLDGTIPIVVEDGEVAIRGGVLDSVGGGVLRYRPAAVGPALREVDRNTELFLRAVENFHYDRIHVGLDEGDAEEMILRFEIEGRNPELYGGTPVARNISLTGPLRRMLSRSLALYRLPERIGDELERFGE